MITMSKNESSRTDADDGDPERFQWDLVTVLVALVIIAILLIVTFDFWLSRSSVPHA